MVVDVSSLYDRRNDERWNRMAVGDILERLSLSDPEHEALVAAPEAIVDPRYARVTYREANDIADRVATGLLATGLGRGEIVVMLTENSVEGYLSKMGVAKAGLVAAPVNTMMADDVVEEMLRFIGAKVAIVDTALWESRAGVFGRAGVRPLIAIGPDEVTPAGATAFHDFVSGAPAGPPDVRIHGDDIWEILLTSGTTAMPKAVMVSHTYSYAAATSFALSATRGLAVESDLRMYTFLPMIYHVGDHAYVMSTFLAGGTVVLGRGLASASIAEVITRERITCLWGGSPQFLEDLEREASAHLKRYDLTSLTVIIYGWNAVSPALVERLTALAGGELHFFGIFGQTEAISCHRFWISRWPELHDRTAPQQNYVGLPSPMLASIIVDEHGESLADRPGEQGEAVYRSPAMMSGYYRDEVATEAAFRDGWFHSGDMAMYGEDGLRIMVDRYKDVVKSGGENVSSLRVEAVLNLHPLVARSAVVGIPDDRWGEAVTAVVIPAQGAEIDEAELIAFCRARLAGFETPKRVVVADELPLTVGGKVLKYRLREQLSRKG
jgi:acyl-CoA synthetase (AMP-forming)/AMP-acid ligase II